MSNYSFLLRLFGSQLSANTAQMIIIEPIQSIGAITNPKIITDPIVAETGSKASNKLAVDGLI